MLEQRKFRRFPLSEGVQCRLSPGQEPMGCLACDLSAGGVRFRAQEFIPLNTELFLQIPLPTRNLLQVKGRVAWVQRVPHGETYQVGVEFQNATAGSRSFEPISAF